MKNKILVIGSINFDMVVFSERLPQPGETVIGKTWQTFPGGKGANQAVAAARLGGDVQMIGNVGEDSAGDTLLQNLKANKVNTSKIKKVNSPSGTALITVDSEGQNTIVVIPGANATLTKKDIDSLKSIIKKTNILILQLEIPLEIVVHAIEIAHQYGVTILLNPAPAATIPTETLNKVTYLIPNESELALLSGLPTNSDEEIQSAANNLFAMGCKQIILTRGKHGAFYLSPQHKISSLPFQVPVVDTTAAGDAFIGAFAVALANDLDLQTALLRANAAGALTVTKAGAQSSLPTLQELDQFLHNNPDPESPVNFSEI
jgi:ribokinase